MDPRSGGLFFMVDGANNFLGHGLYQFCPELLWRMFSRIELMLDDVGKPNPRDVPDPCCSRTTLEYDDEHGKNLRRHGGSEDI